MAHPFPYSPAQPADPAVWHDLRPHPGRDGYVENQSRPLPAHRVGNLHLGSPAARVEKQGRRGPARGGVSMDARPPGRSRNCRGLNRRAAGMVIELELLVGDWMIGTHLVFGTW